MNLNVDNVASVEPCRPSLGELFEDLRAELAVANGLKKAKVAKANAAVLSVQVDPYAMDTPANRMLAEWVAEHINRIGHGRHMRGYFYAMLGVADLEGKPLANAHATWMWLQRVVNMARWLGYIPFDAVIDERNEEPVVIVRSGGGLGGPFVYIPTIGIEIPDEINLKPSVSIMGNWTGAQPFRLSFWGEKTSLRAILVPFSEQHHADLYLPTGEGSTTMIHILAKAAAEDGRPVVVFVFTDCDPAGYQMLVSLAHKLRAFRDLHYPKLRFHVVPVALTVEQVKGFRNTDNELPETPLKEEEKRADGWLRKHGVQQTEIDALATLRPQLLRHMIRRAVAPYWDAKLGDRVRDAHIAWHHEAQRRLDAAVADADLDDEQAEIETVFGELRDAAARFRDRMDDYRERVRRLRVDFPPAEIPATDLPEPPPGLVHSAMPLAEHVAVLRDRKDYGDPEPANAA